jgi:hypothetical protein
MVLIYRGFLEAQRMVERLFLVPVWSALPGTSASR